MLNLPRYRSTYPSSARSTIDKFAGAAQDGKKRFPMASSATNPKQQAHELIERMSIGQVSAVVGLLEAMLDPVDRAIANAPWEDEPISEEESRAVAASKQWLAEHSGEGIPHEEVLREFGLTSDNLDR
jgi:hypothetical protein